MLFKLLRLYFRETWNSHNLAFLGVMLLLATLLLYRLAVRLRRQARVLPAGPAFHR